MANLNTRIIGYPDYVSLGSKKSTIISDETIITDIEEISSYAQNSMGWTTPNSNTVTSVGDISEGFNIFGEYYPEIYLSIPSAGTYEISPVKTAGIQISYPEGNATDISCDIKYASYISIIGSDFESISFPSLVKYSGNNSIDFTGNQNLQTVNLPLFESFSYVIPGGFSMQINTGSVGLSEINLQSLQNGSLVITNNPLSSTVCNINIDSLENPTKLEFVGFTDIDIDFSAIKSIYKLFLEINGNVNGGTVISIPNLNYVKRIQNDYANNFELYSGISITSFLMPNVIEYVDSVSMGFYNCSNLSEIIFGTVGVLKKANSPYIDLQAAATLTSAQAEATVAPFVSLDGTNGTTLSENGTLFIDVIIPISTTLQGYFDTLVSRGWTIVLNA